jgi:type VI secretion system protein ImpK
LAPQELARQVQVDEHGARTVIILTVPELFESGSAQPTRGHEELLAAVGRALQAVPGRIMIEGHTDDQPVHSFTYTTNFDLSRARAVAIAQQLKPYLSDFSRVQPTGLGSLQPRALPPSTPENRRLNRRVEIVHLAQ